MNLLTKSSLLAIAAAIALSEDIAKAGTIDLGSLNGYAMFADTTGSTGATSMNLNNITTYGTLAAPRITGVASNTYFGNMLVSGSNTQPPGTILGPYAFSNGNTLAQQQSDAIALSTQLAGFSATQTLSGISSNITVAGNGGWNVIDVNGDITNGFSLSGGANDVFVFNVTGTLDVANAVIADRLSNDIAINHIIFNFIGTTPNQTVSTTSSSAIYGTLLSVNGNYHYSLNSSGWGSAIDLYNGATAINASSMTQFGDYAFSAPSPAPSPVPLPAALWSGLTLLSVLGLGKFARRRTA